MQRLALCAMAVVLTTTSGFAQPTGGGPGAVIGIVEVPKMFTVDPQSGQYVDGALTLYTRADSASPVATTITSRAAIDDAEYGYEEAGALVYRRQAGFFLIRTARGLAWLAPHDAGGFHSLETLLLEGLTHLTDAWNGVVATAPGGDTRTRVSRPAYGSPDVNVKGFRTVAGRLWVNVEVMSHSFCESDTPPTVRVRGWIPAHNQSGAPTVWFSSRGC